MSTYRLGGRILKALASDSIRNAKMIVSTRMCNGKWWEAVPVAWVVEVACTSWAVDSEV